MCLLQGLHWRASNVDSSDNIFRQKENSAELFLFKIPIDDSSHDGSWGFSHYSLPENCWVQTWMRPSNRDYLNWFKCHSMFHHMAAWSCFSARVVVLIAAKWCESESGAIRGKCRHWSCLKLQLKRSSDLTFIDPPLIYAISVQIKLHQFAFSDRKFLFIPTPE